jgi:allantoin racemase
VSEPALIRYQSFVDPEEHGAYIDRLQRRLDAIAGPGVRYKVLGMTPAAHTLHALTEWRCAQQMIRNGVQSERAGAVAFVSGHFPDPGLYELRAAVDIPVIGLGEAAMLYACTLGRRAGVVTIHPIFIPIIREQIVRYGLRDRIVAVRAMETDPAQMNAAFDSPGALEEIVGQFEAQAAPMVAEGVEVLLPGGGFPALLFADIQNFAVAGAPVLDGIAVAAGLAEMAVRLAATGIRPSRTAGFAPPSTLALQEFLEA